MRPIPRSVALPIALEVLLGVIIGAVVVVSGRPVIGAAIVVLALIGPPLALVVAANRGDRPKPR